ncbi:ricin-type beta-trefoil lectin domain protein [Kribbella sp. CA-293567]|uniref:ricin-type beta-trefoil lectin domain protein n=1 Tax=Kribbella sp. CA-293567 TaxID=3002436 RepID=UPI0022DCFCDD|nr:family 16 glycosylhydrolase [Kribbella sp. CA-293567]WBQ07150.1 family 16 glycosylhydrolase [Kribbella sp. CA-293567]
MSSSRTRFRSAALLAAGAALIGTALLQSPATAGTSATDSAGAAAAPAAAAAVGPVIWEDNFDGPNGQAPDSSKWRYDIGGSGWGNNERQYYTNSTRNAAKDGAGNLVITARRESGGFQCHYGPCEYTSARLLTAQTFTQTYGRYEARIKLPRTQGIWPAFWMLGTGNAGWPGNGEIDIMEHIGKEPTNAYGTLHGPGYSAAEGISSRYTLPNGQVFSDAFHTFTVDWEPNAVTWYVDGIQFARKTPADLGGDPWVFDHPFFMIMNVAVGGYWPGYPDGTTVMPQSMVVDYVRVNSLTSGGGGTGGEVKALNKCMDVAGASSADGTPVQLYDCNGSAAQKWNRPGDGTIRALGKCLDIAGGGTAEGTKLQIATCSGNPAQQWTYTGAKDLVNPQSNKCLDVPSGSAANGNRLQIWTCNGSAAQKWTL